MFQKQKSAHYNGRAIIGKGMRMAPPDARPVKRQRGKRGHLTEQDLSLGLRMSRFPGISVGKGTSGQGMSRCYTTSSTEGPQ